MHNTDGAVCAIPARILALLTLIVALPAAVTLAQPTPVPPDDAFPPLPANRSVISSKWIIPSGLSLDARQRVQTFIEVQAKVDKAASEEIDWLKTLPELQAILAADSDTLVSPRNELQATDQFHPAIAGPPRVSLKQAVTELVVGLPRAGKQAWRQLYADTALVQLNDAMAKGDQQDVAIVASSFIETPAGWQAAEQTGIRSLDIERPIAAIRYLDRLRQSSDARATREPQLSMAIAAAWTLLGRDDQAGLVIAQLKTFLAQRSAASNDAPQAEAAELQRLIDTPVRELLAGIGDTLGDRIRSSDVVAEWTHPAGDVSNSASVLPVAPVGNVLWRSFTDGFAVRSTAEDRAPFMTPWADYDEEAYPETTGQLAGLIELGLEYLDRVDIEEAQLGLPAGQPLVVGNLAVMRTLDRVRAVDVKTGSIAWESFQQDPAFLEQFSLLTAKQALNFPRSEIRSPVNSVQEALLRARTRFDRTTGTLTSDGERVYVVTGGGIASPATRYGNARLYEMIPKSTNTLRAIDLMTGRLAWEIGGSKKSPSLPGAGRFFLGPPTCLDDGLYVVAEEDNLALLLVIDPESGRTTWQQELGQVISPAINEAVRRSTGEAPVVAGGLVVCTTSSGQVFAIDRSERRIAWASGYSSLIPPPRRFPAMLRMTGQPINTDLLEDLNRWRETVAIPRGGRLIVSAVDSPVLMCLDVVTGQTLWSKPRRDDVFVAAVLDDHVVLAGEYGVRSLDILSGETQWMLPFQKRQLTGRGVRSGNIYHLPIAVVVPPEQPQAADSPDEEGENFDGTILPPIDQLEGAILSLNLTTGRVLAESPTPEGVRLGNLAAADGRIVSQSFDSVVGLESITELNTRLATQVAGKPDPAKLITRARHRLHNGDSDGIGDLLKGLGSIPRGYVAPDTTAMSRAAESLLIGQMLEAQRHGEDLDNRLFEVLDQIDLDADSRLTMQRVKTDSLLKQQQFAEAFRQLVKLGKAPVEAPQVPTLTAEGVTRALPVWVAHRLADTYRLAAATDDAAAQVEQLEELIANELQQAETASDADREAHLQTWLNLFSWHVRATDVRLRLAASRPAADPVSVERLLSPLMASDHPATVARALGALTTAYIKADRGSVALTALQQLEQSAARDGVSLETTQFDGRPLNQQLEAWRKAPTITAALNALEWPDGQPVETVKEEESTDIRERYFVERVGDASAAFDGWTLEIDPEGLTGFDADGLARWTVSGEQIDGFPESRQRFRAVWLNGGSLIAVVINADMTLFDASVSPPKLLWSRSLISNDPSLVPFGQKSYEFGRQVATYRLRSGSRWLGAVDLLTATCMVWRSSNRMHVVDARTGDLLWERPAPSGEGLVFGDDRLLVLAELAPGQSRVFETSTGRLLATFDLPEGTYLQTVSGAIPSFVTPGEKQFDYHALDVLTGEQRWSFSHDRTAAVTLPFGKRLITLQKDATLIVRDVLTGTVIAELETNLPPTKLSDLHFHATPTGFVMFTWAPPPRSRFGVNRLSTQARAQSPVNGYVCGIDLQTPRVIWEQEVRVNFMQTPQPRNLPLILLASSHTRTDDGVNLRKPRYELTAIDTRTGNQVVNFTADESFTNADARRVIIDGKQASQIEVHLSGSKQPAIITLDYKQGRSQ
ncbi:MAG: outer membrane protein assembly factor BamB family protein [Planctomycetota bacterium]|jgi:outer membrane protein assembly factor BamB